VILHDKKHFSPAFKTKKIQIHIKTVVIFVTRLAYNNSTIKYKQNKGCQIKMNFLIVIHLDKKHFSPAFERKQNIEIAVLFFNNSTLK
jgi:hypothetical protein